MVRDAIIIGYSQLAEELIKSQIGNKRPILRFRGVIADYGMKSIEITKDSNKASIPLLGELNDFPSALESDKYITKPILVLAVSEERDGAFLQKLSYCISRGYEIYEIVDVYEMATDKVPVEHVNEHWLLHAFNKPQIGYVIFKKLVDFIFALSGIIFSLPLFVVIGALIKATSKGPVFYRQIRTGKGGREFVIYKFRTMVCDAEQDEAVWAVKDDPRITKVGRWLRRMRLDELPQLINVLQGEMSIIGPRPERPEFVKQLSQEIPFYNYRHVVKPGITGWAQVKYCYACSVDGSMQKLQYDLYGIRNASIEYDVEVVLRTMWVMLSGAGAH